MNKKIVLTLLLLATICSSMFSQLIPRPVEMQRKNGHFEPDNNTTIIFDKNDNELENTISFFADRIEHITGISLSENNKDAYKSICFEKINGNRHQELGNEGYILDVDNKKIIVQYRDVRGAFYGAQSLLQFLPMVRTNEKPIVPNLTIKDYPRYAWRGMMLDVSRHFFTVETIKNTLDMLAFYKINTFHWHLCDNEGWRLEIKKYPKLTEVGAWRMDMPYSRIYQKDYVPTGTPYKYGGYYTQEQAREVVEYAKKLNITVIPEIEMPGHSGAALAAYPEYSCTQTPNETPNKLLHQSKEHSEKFHQNYCAGNDAAFDFLEDVLAEVFDIFPSEYIHIGGDEVDKKDWKNCPKCQARMKAEHLKNEEELQSYFIRRIEKFLLKHNRKLLGWDEILEGKLAESATVMSWRGEKGGIEAAKMGHHVVMTPSNPLYFIRHQDSTDVDKFHAPTYSINSLDKVYAYNPSTDKLSKKEHEYILGSQFAVWTEFMPSVGHFEYMVYPRMQAFAELVWTPLARKDFDDFVERLNQYHFPYWQMLGIRFHPRYYKDIAY